MKRTYSYLKENNDEDKKAKATKKCAIKRELKFQDYKNFLNCSTREENEDLGKKIKISVDNLKGHQKEFVKKTKLIAQQRFKSERHKVFFTKVINMIALSSKEHIKKQSKLARNS